jgi:hypothetical protein
MSEDPFELVELLEKQIMQHIQITSMQMTQDPFEHLELLEKQIRYAAHPIQINVMTEDPFELLQLLENPGYPLLSITEIVQHSIERTHLNGAEHDFFKNLEVYLRS